MHIRHQHVYRNVVVMPGWSEIKNESQVRVTPQNPNGGVFFLVEQKKRYLRELSEHTGRNTILYFSAFLNKQRADALINDRDINAFMETVHKLDRKKGLDLILHTPGGDISATEQIIKYLRSMFDGDIRAIIPQMAMSAGSMIAVSSRSIMMGKQSCLGPFDPQINGLPCQSVLKEFDRAVRDVSSNPSSLGLWQAIISKLHPTFLTICQQADELSRELADDILKYSQYSDEVRAEIKRVFVDNGDSKVHSRHIDVQRCKDTGLNIESLESDSVVQDLVLSIHHCCMILGEASNLVKIVENNIGGEYSLHLPPQQPQVPGPLMQFQIGEPQMP